MDAIIETLKKNRPHLSASSIKTYKSILKNIYDKCFDDKEYHMKNFDNDKCILTFLKDMPYNKRKTVLASLSVLTDNKNYNKIMMEDIHAYKENEMKQEKTEQQKEGMISVDEIKNLYNDLEHNAKQVMKKTNLNFNDINTIMKWVLLALTGGIFQAPRRSIDFGNMKFKNYDSEKDNYIDVKNSKFIFQNYKTAKTYGKQETEVSKPLKAILNKWFKIIPDGCDYILFDNKLNPLTSPQITHRLNEIFGKKISTSMLRHIYLTNKFSGVNLEELQKTATEMGNSPMQALLYVKKD
jgi:hypothetical protein